MKEILEMNENLNSQNVLSNEIPNRKYKDRVFRMLFNDKEHLLELYNAMNGTAYTNTEDLTITTLENALYLGMKNDISYVLHDQLLLYEHQSTENPNMPLRNLLYVADVYSKLMANENLFSRSLKKIPQPKFFVFYNGVDEIPERIELKLSDAYEHAKDNDTDSEEKPSLELVTQVLNINKGFNEKLKEGCNTLREYMIFVDTVREYSKKMPFAEAMPTAIDNCIKQNILADFLRKNRAEVLKVSLYEYDEEKQLEMERNEAEELGRIAGRVEGESIGEARGRAEGEACGRTKGIFSSIKNLMESMNWSAEQAMDALKISESDRKQYFEALSKKE